MPKKDRRNSLYSTGKKRINRPGYYLGVDKIGRKTWKVISKYRNKNYKDIRNGDIVKIDDENNGTAEEINKKIVVLKNHKNNRKVLIYGKENHDSMSMNIGASIAQASLSKRADRVAGTDMTPKEVSEAYEALKYKIGQVVRSEKGNEFFVAGASRDKTILSDKSGFLFTAPTNDNKLEIVQESESINSDKVIRYAFNGYSKFLKNKVDYENDYEKPKTNGSVIFIQDLKSILSFLTGINDEVKKPKNYWGDIPSLRGKFL